MFYHKRKFSSHGGVLWFVENEMNNVYNNNSILIAVSVVFLGREKDYTMYNKSMWLMLMKKKQSIVLICCMLIF